MKALTVEQYRAHLRKEIARKGHNNCARAWGVDQSNLSNVIAGRKEPFRQLVSGSGFKKRTVYEAA